MMAGSGSFMSLFLHFRQHAWVQVRVFSTLGLPPKSNRCIREHTFFTLDFLFEFLAWVAISCSFCSVAVPLGLPSRPFSELSLLSVWPSSDCSFHLLKQPLCLTSNWKSFQNSKQYMIVFFICLFG